jgi:hypothetical protein
MVFWILSHFHNTKGPLQNYTKNCVGQYVLNILVNQNPSPKTSITYQIGNHFSSSSLTLFTSSKHCILMLLMVCYKITWITCTWSDISRQWKCIMMKLSTIWKLKFSKLIFTWFANSCTTMSYLASSNIHWKCHWCKHYWGSMYW